MFKALETTNVNPSFRAGKPRILQRSSSVASTTFSDSSNRVIKVSFITKGKRGNNYVANLLKISATKYRFRLYAPDGTRLNTVTKEDATPPSTVIAQLVDLVNNNATFKKYIRVKFLNETTEAMSDSVDIGDGQRLTGGK